MGHYFTASTTESGTSREQEHDDADNHCEDKAVVQQQQPPTSIRFEGALFLHVGKAGGGSVKWRMKHEWGIVIPHSHPYPNIPRIAAFPQPPPILIDIRDPVERFVSAVQWRLTVMCGIDGHEHRTSDGNTLEHPDQFC